MSASQSMRTRQLLFALFKLPRVEISNKLQLALGLALHALCMASTKKIVLKVSITCVKCKICVMTIVSKFCGIDSLSVDGEKNTLTIVGSVDAVLIVKALRKAKKPAEIVSIGEPDKEEKKEEKDLPACCNACSNLLVFYDEPSSCIII